MVYVSAGFQHNCALDDIGKVTCWGLSDAGQIDIPDQIQVISYGQVQGGNANAESYRNIIDPPCDDQINKKSKKQNKFTNKSKNSEHTRITNNNNNNNIPLPPVPLSSTDPLFSTISIKAGSMHSCAINRAGVLICWGMNSHGQTDIPKGLEFNTLYVSAGFQDTCAIRGTGHLHCFGS